MPTGASIIIPVTGTPSNTFPPGTLSPNTNYEYYVRAVCSPTESSLWAGPRPFTTTQIPAIVNFVEDFEESLGEPVRNSNRQPHYTFICWFCYEELAYNIARTLYPESF